MPLSWNEIKDRAMAFSKEWALESAEDAEAKSFWDDFFFVFGISRRRVASFEFSVKKLGGRKGFIDLLWKGVLLVEHKSRGRNLDSAYAQAIEYFPGIKERDLPRYVLISDFARFRLHDLEENQEFEFSIENFHKNVHLFGFMAGYQSHCFGKEDQVNIKASDELGYLHDLLKESGYHGYALEKLLVRLLFCLFADDTGIFERHQFREFIELRTSKDGSDLGLYLAQVFQVLNTPLANRQRTLDEQLASFPYVNGKLFAETLPLASFNRKMRENLLDSCAIDWSRISPEIFGALFQSIMDKQMRRSLGAHYTSEKNILKALKPLFLDELETEFNDIRHQKQKLHQFHQKLGNIKLLDPACGCGNFLVVAYRELRLLELQVLRKLYQKSDTPFLSIADIVRVNVDQFYGIEVEEFPSQIAQVALWLVDHQMNLLVSEEFGQYFNRLPLIKTAKIVHGNALHLDWAQVVAPEHLNYIVGNPPFVGYSYQSKEQKNDIKKIFGSLKGSAVLDYVSCWYRKSVDLMEKNPKICTAFVSTNSITQGEQVGILWPNLCQSGLKINFAYRAFNWTSTSKGKAAVYCVIIGFALREKLHKQIFSYQANIPEARIIKAKNINPYLVDASNLFLQRRLKPILESTPTMLLGNTPRDGGNLILTEEEKEFLIQKEITCAPWIRPFLGSREFINGKERYCLWLKDISPDALRKMPAVLERVEAVRKFRLASNRAETKKMANMPNIFSEIRQPTKGNYLLIPRVSSDRRPYVPIGFVSSEVICSDANSIIPGANLFHFGLLSSKMHMSWTRSTCGRLKNDYRYSAVIVYNNFPWPEATAKQQQVIEKAAQAVLSARQLFSNSTLADLYDPLTMPKELHKAHKSLDRAVDSAYRSEPFSCEASRVSYLFNSYQRLTDNRKP